ncbi:Uncharacterised protein [Mycobacteroides abscessus subsp. abscessus]|nr:Uncharacterised protein [Mycobacteroides abscessus subsp. abscessus]
MASSVLPCACWSNRPDTQLRTWSGSTLTTLCVPSSVQPSSRRIGIVANATLPPDSFCSCWMKSMTSHPWLSTTVRVIASRSLPSVVVLVRVPLESAECANDDITTCCRTTRSRSPRGRSWR